MRLVSSDIIQESYLRRNVQMRKVRELYSPDAPGPGLTPSLVQRQVDLSSSSSSSSSLVPVALPESSKNHRPTGARGCPSTSAWDLPEAARPSAAPRCMCERATERALETKHVKTKKKTRKLVLVSLVLISQLMPVCHFLHLWLI